MHPPIQWAVDTALVCVSPQMAILRVLFSSSEIIPPYSLPFFPGSYFHYSSWSS